MKNARRTMQSRYMEWAKTRSQARCNLATSGIMNVPRAEFPLQVEELEITTSAAGYGYPPLQQRLAQRTGAPEACIVAATGTSMANHLAMAAVLAPGDEVLIEQPAYGPLLDVADYLGEGEERLGHRDVAPERLGELVPGTGLLGDQAIELLGSPLVHREALVDQRDVVRDRIAVPGEDDLSRQFAGLLQRLEIDDQGLGALCGSIERSRDQRI